LAILNSLSELLDIPTNPDARGTNGALADQDSSALLQVMDKNLFIKFSSRPGWMVDVDFLHFQPPLEFIIPQCKQATLEAIIPGLLSL
jgi:hypothetical protein